MKTQIQLVIRIYIRLEAWAPARIFAEGAKKRGLTKMTYSARTKIFAIFRRFTLNLRVFDASAEGYFQREQHMTSSFSNATAADV